MELNRKQELLLIDLGFRWLLEHLPKDLMEKRMKNTLVIEPGKSYTYTKGVKPKRKSKKRKWSPEQREKFSASMKKYWANKRK